MKQQAERDLAKIETETLAIAAGYMFAKRSITQAFNFLEARLKIPNWIQELPALLL